MRGQCKFQAAKGPAGAYPLYVVILLPIVIFLLFCVFDCLYDLLNFSVCQQSISAQAVPHTEEARPIGEAEVPVELAGEALDYDDRSSHAHTSGGKASSPQSQKTLACRYVTSNGEVSHSPLYRTHLETQSYNLKDNVAYCLPDL